MALHDAKSGDVNENLWLCHECDLIIRPSHIRANRTILCPRCRCEVANTELLDIQSGMMLVATGLILFIPAITLPIMSVHLLGGSNKTSVIDCIIALYESNFLVIATLIFALTIFVPLLRFGSMLVVFTAMKGSRLITSNILFNTLKLYRFISAWRMLDIYLLGIIVTFVKLGDMATVELYIPGLLAFASVMTIEIMLIRVFNLQTIWRWAIETQLKS